MYMLFEIVVYFQVFSNDWTARPWGAVPASGDNGRTSYGRSIMFAVNFYNQ